MHASSLVGLSPRSSYSVAFTNVWLFGGVVALHSEVEAMRSVTLEDVVAFYDEFIR